MKKAEIMQLIDKCHLPAVVLPIYSSATVSVLVKDRDKSKGSEIVLDRIGNTLRLSHFDLVPEYKVRGDLTIRLTRPQAREVADYLANKYFDGEN